MHGQTRAEPQQAELRAFENAGQLAAVMVVDCATQYREAAMKLGSLAMFGQWPSKVGLAIWRTQLFASRGDPQRSLPMHGHTFEMPQHTAFLAAIRPNDPWSH